MAKPDAKGRSMAMAEQQSARLTLTAFDDVEMGTGGDWLVKGLIPTDGLVVLYGPTGCGKSFKTTDISLHVSLGWDYRGRRVQKKPVVYIAAEGPNGFRRRIEAWRREHLETYEHFVPAWFLFKQINLIEDWTELATTIRETVGILSPGLIVIDTLARTIDGDENSSDDMGLYIAAATALRERFNCCVLIVHHTGYDKSHPRGSTALMAAADTSISVKREDELIVATIEKQRDGDIGDKVVSRLEQRDLGIDFDGDSITSCVIVPADNEYRGNVLKVSGQAATALDVLREAIEVAGEISPASNHIPRTTKAVQSGVWKDYLRDRSITESDKPDSFNKAFKRSAQTLQERGFIGVWQDWVWLADKRT